MTYAFTPAPQPTLPIKGSDKVFPIHRIYCVGRNYAEHTKEMGGDTKDPPFFFQKNPDNIVIDGKFPYPPATQNLHFEIELVVGLKSGGVNIKAADAMSHLFGYAVGIDMTRRDLQDVAKKLARPWEVAKAFECVRTLHRTGAGGPGCRSVEGRHLGRRQRRAAADRRPRADDLGHPQPDRIPLDAIRAEGRGPHLHRHTRGRRRHQEGRQDEGSRRRGGRSRGRGDLTRTLGPVRGRREISGRQVIHAGPWRSDAWCRAWSRRRRATSRSRR